MQHNLLKMKLPPKTTHLTEMTIDTGDSDPITQKPYPIAI